MKNAANGSNFFAKPDIGSKFGFFVCGDAILGGFSTGKFWVFLVKFIVIHKKYKFLECLGREIITVLLFAITTLKSKSVYLNTNNLYTN